MSDKDISYQEGFQPGYLGRMVQLQGEHYDVFHAVPGMNFEVMMARQLCEFHEQYDAQRDLLLTAHAGNRLVGYLAVVGSQQYRPGARLRWFMVEADYRGEGIGRELLRRALEFCRRLGFKSVWLWTVEQLETARRLYDEAGFEYIADSSIDIPEQGLIMELRLV